MHPRLWPRSTRWLIAFAIASIIIPMDMFSTIYSGGQKQIMQDFGISHFVATLGVGLVNLGIAIGPLFGAPLSELYGRQPIYIIAAITFTCFAAGSALSNDAYALLFCRFFAALFGSAAFALFGGSLSDLFTPTERAPLVALFSLILQGAPTLGPVVGSAIGQYTSWRWVLAVPAIWAGAMTLPLFFVPETEHGVIKARERRKAQGKPMRVFVANLPEDTSPGVFWRKALLTPLTMLYREPIVLVTSIYHAFVYSLLFILLEAYPYAFETTYHFNLLQTGLVFLSPALGNVLGVLLYFGYLKRIEEKPINERSGTPPSETHSDNEFTGSISKDLGTGEKSPPFILSTTDSDIPRIEAPSHSPLPLPIESIRYDNKNQPVQNINYNPSPFKPEARLPGVLLAACFVPTGLFWFAATSSNPSIHYLIPIASGLPTGAGMTLLQLSLSNYYIDLYPDLSASALAANLLVRHIFATWFPTFALPMYQSVGLRNASLVLAGVSLMGVPGGWALWGYGSRLRRRSRWAVQDGDAMGPGGGDRISG